MSAESEIKGLRQEVSNLASEIDGATRQVASLVRQLEQDDHLRERADAAEERERDKRHEELLEALERIRKSSEATGTYLRDLPDKLLRHVERKIYELRIARYEARQAGVQNEPALLPPAPTTPAGREPTGKIIAQIEGKDESTALTPAQQRGLVKVVRKVWEYKFHGVGGGIAIHWLWERAANIVAWLHHF